MYAPSREALAHVRLVLDEQLGGASVSTGEATSGRSDAAAIAGRTGSEILDVVELLDGNRTLRSALADASTPASQRRALAEQLLTAKVGSSSAAVIGAAVEQNWSQSADLIASLELLGREALFKSAREQGQLETVEDELFRLGRIVAGNPSLEQALSDRARSIADKRTLLAKVLYGKVTSITQALGIQAVGRLNGEQPADAFDALSNAAASLRDQQVAQVRAVAELTKQQRDTLIADLTKLYDKSVTLHVDVVPDLVGGLVVKVGDELIDGSIKGQFDKLRKN